MGNLIKKWTEEDGDWRDKRTLTVIAVTSTVVVGGIIYVALRMKRKHGNEIVDEQEVMVPMGPADRTQDPKQRAWHRAIHIPQRVFRWFKHSTDFQRAAEALGKEGQDEGGTPEDPDTTSS